MSRLLLGAGASAALHKAVDLASLLRQRGHEVRVVLTPRAARLVSPQLFEAVSGQEASVDEFGAERRGAMDHIELARWAELCAVAPATASVVARLAHGMADDLLGTVSLALEARVPRLIAPAMNPSMLAQPAVARNLAQLVEDGWVLAEPASGHTACGEPGSGRLPEPEELADAIERLLGGGAG